MASDNGFFSNLFGKVMANISIQSAKSQGMLSIEKMKEQNPKLAEKAEKLQENAEKLKESMGNDVDISEKL